MLGQIFTSLQFKLLGISIALLVIGYILLGQGPVDNHLSWSVAPAILVIVYCILIPLTIIYRGKKSTSVEKISDKKGV